MTTPTTVDVGRGSHEPASVEIDGFRGRLMSAGAIVRLKRGSLYFSREVYDRYFPRLETIILLRRSDDLVILPVRHAAAGGCILALRPSLTGVNELRG